MEQRTVLAVAVTILAWASAFVAIRSVGEHVGPGPLAEGRLLVGSLALWALQARRSWVAPTRREWAGLLLVGLAWFAVYNVALNAAERRLDAGTTAMLVNVGPILIALLAARFLAEPVTRALGLGAAIAFGGALLIGLATRGSGAAGLGGVALALLAAATYATAVVTQKPLTRRLPALQITAIACTIGTVACLPFLPGLLDAAGSAPAGALAGIVYLGLVPTAIAFATWAYALTRTPAGRLGISTYLVPPLAALGAWAVLGDPPPALALLGGALCLGGVAVSRLPDARLRRARPSVAVAGSAS